MNWSALIILGTLTIMWGFSAFVGLVLPVGWLVEWYGFPFCMTTFVGAVLWVAYCLAKEKEEGK
jgi:hypothetical protein